MPRTIVKVSAKYLGHKAKADDLGHKAKTKDLGHKAKDLGHTAKT